MKEYKIEVDCGNCHSHFEIKTNKLVAHTHGTCPICGLYEKVVKARVVYTSSHLFIKVPIIKKKEKK